MPIHDVGYRNWRGVLTPAWSRWSVIAEAGILGALKSRWTRRTMLASWLPVLYLGIVFFFFEKVLEAPQSDLISRNPELAELVEQAGLQEEAQRVEGAVDERLMMMRQREFSEFVEVLPNSHALIEAFNSGNPNEIRNRTWCYLLMSFLRYPQGLMTLLLVGLVVPPLIARDVRSKAFLLYYSKPIGRAEYVLGKLAIPGVTLMLITLVPALGLYCFGVMLSPNLSVLWDTWDIPIRIGLAAAVGIVPTCILALMFSSMSQESRFASFAWFAVWGLGAVVWTAIYSVHLNRAAMTSNTSPDLINVDSQWSLISLYSTIGRVQSWVFGLETDFQRILPSLVTLTLVTLIALVILYRRVSAPIRM